MREEQDQGASPQTEQGMGAEQHSEFGRGYLGSINNTNMQFARVWKKDCIDGSFPLILSLISFRKILRRESDPDGQHPSRAYWEKVWFLCGDLQIFEMFFQVHTEAENFPKSAMEEDSDSDDDMF